MAEPLGPAEHRRRGTTAAQPLIGMLQPHEAADTPVKAAAAATPALISAALDLDHADTQIFHRGGGHLQQRAAQGIVSRQAVHIDAATPLRQQLTQGFEWELPAHHLPVACEPGSGADVFEIHRQQRPTVIERCEGEEVVVEPEATAAQGIAPLHQQLTAVALRYQQLILQGNAGVGALLPGGAKSVAGQGNRAAQGLKRQGLRPPPRSPHRPHRTGGDHPSQGGAGGGGSQPQ